MTREERGITMNCYKYLVQIEEEFKLMTWLELHNYFNIYDDAPSRVYRLCPDKPPERMWSVKIKNRWMLGDIYRNMIET